MASAQGQNLVNRGFESGSFSSWSASYGTYAINASEAWYGAYCASVASGSAVQQTLSGLTPNTAYTVSACVKVGAAGQRAYLGVLNYGGASVSQSTVAATYTRLSQSFTTGPSSTSATVFVYQSGTGFAYCDDFSVFRASSDLAGVSAGRIADVLERFGANVFSKVDYLGTPWAWGGSQGDYDATNTANAINYLTNNSGLTINLREYHQDVVGGRALTPYQTSWMRNVYQATGSRFTLAIAAGGNSNAIPGMSTLR